MTLSTNDFIGDLERWYKAYNENMKALSYAINTIELYSRAIYGFIEYSHGYQDEMKLSEVKSLFIAGFLTYLEDEARKGKKSLKNGHYLSKSTKQTYLKAIKSFFTFISDNNDELHTFDRYFKNIKVADSSKSEERLIYLSEEEIVRLHTALEREKSKKEGYNAYRNALLIKLMLYAGLRISEALQVKLTDFKGGEAECMYSIDIYGKGGKDQFAYIAKEIINDEIEYMGDLKMGCDALIMVTQSGQPLDRTNAYTIVNRLYLKAGIAKKGLHLLRHTLAMRLTKRDVNPIVIKKILRHSNLNTTTLYAKATEESVEKAMVGGAIERR
ncbi:MAG: tyrosine-type recombinase/integrase [Campylobacterales bacterium]|nr:tyrosine-type recombinase/integrase [Campylobacterales bacterium]